MTAQRTTSKRITDAVHVGQIWQDGDPRVNNRLVRVKRVSDDQSFAWVENINPVYGGLLHETRVHVQTLNRRWHLIAQPVFSE